MLHFKADAFPCCMRIISLFEIWLYLLEKRSIMLDSRLLPWQGPKVDQRLFAANTVLQLSTLELEQAICQELNENPALEMVEHTTCRICGAPLSAGYCARCSESERLGQELPSQVDAS